jgi:aminocarboxymuconate-semialdehyde decarboxylase
MVRLVFSGVFARYPGLKMIIHHYGALVPLFAQRMRQWMSHLGGPLRMMRRTACWIWT